MEGGLQLLPCLFTGEVSTSEEGALPDWGASVVVGLLAIRLQ
jgi:hypothetical protein